MHQKKKCGEKNTKQNKSIAGRQHVRLATCEASRVKNATSIFSMQNE